MIKKDDANIKGQKIDYLVTVIHKSSKGFYYYGINNNSKGIIFQQDRYDDKYEGIKLLLNEKAQNFMK